MKLSKDNKDAIKSSLAVGVAWGMFWGALIHISPKTTANPIIIGVVMFVIGLLVGLFTTWDVEDVADSNADV